MQLTQTESVSSPDVTLDIALQYRSTGRSHLRHLTIQEDAGTVILSGVVPSFYLKQLAQELAASVDGVTIIHNDTIVRTPPE